MKGDDIIARPGENIKHFVWRNGKDVSIVRGLDNQWRDEHGTVYAIPDADLGGDKPIACGAGIFSLPSHWAITSACRAHDFAYSSVTYQNDHSRDEADEMLKQHVLLIEKNTIEADLLLALARFFGWKFWDNPNTNT